MLGELRVTPVGGPEDFAHIVAGIVRVVAQTDLQYRVDAMGTTVEGELDEILAQAASLTSELSRQLGNEEEPAPTPVSTAERELDGLDDLEADLGELERLVGADAEVQPDDAAASPQEPAAPQPAAAVPDFMSEFTQPEEPKEPAAAAAAEDEATAEVPTSTVVGATRSGEA